MTKLPKPDDASDTAAVEQIRGEPPPQVWPQHALPPGTRVRVIQAPDRAGPWVRQFLGTISDMAAPELVWNKHARPGELAYWVTFDEAEQDESGDGPYRKAQIWERYLEPT